MLATSSATVSIQQASTYPLLATTSAAMAKDCSMPDGRSGMFSRIPSTSVW